MRCVQGEELSVTEQQQAAEALLLPNLLLRDLSNGKTTCCCI